MTESTPIIEVVDVSQSYQTSDGVIRALSDVTLQVQEGEFVSLVGPSGCGKSTLLNVVAALLRPTSGVVRYRGDDHIEPRSEFGVMFQAPILLPWRSLEENVRLPGEILGIPEEVLTSRVDEVLEMTGLEEFRAKYPWELSGGMAQRASLCRLLASDPEILLLDEPFGALDEFTRESLDDELLRIWRGTNKTAMFVTHNIGEAVYLSDRVVVMTPRPGRIAKVLPVQLPRPRAASMLRDRNYLDMVFEIRGMLGVATT
ncbi:MAG: ATP-binding cassette domain-containing protein [Acidimicrobiia bacterium]|nr:ATP-binding cassette domain-containing protein [Acidimicrobiia bacterium]